MLALPLPPQHIKPLHHTTCSFRNGLLFDFLFQIIRPLCWHPCIELPAVPPASLHLQTPTTDSFPFVFCRLECCLDCCAMRLCANIVLRFQSVLQLWSISLFHPTALLGLLLYPLSSSPGPSLPILNEIGTEEGTSHGSQGPRAGPSPQSLGSGPWLCGKGPSDPNYLPGAQNLWRTWHSSWGFDRCQRSLVSEEKTIRKQWYAPIGPPQWPGRAPPC